MCRFKHDVCYYTGISNVTMTFLQDRQQLERSAQVMIFTENVLTLTIFIPTFPLFFKYNYSKVLDLQDHMHL